eukprot:2821910-Rhodomonas_salina.1
MPPMQRQVLTKRVVLVRKHPYGTFRAELRQCMVCVRACATAVSLCDAGTDIKEMESPALTERVVLPETRWTGRSWRKRKRTTSGTPQSSRRCSR